MQYSVVIYHSILLGKSDEKSKDQRENRMRQALYTQTKIYTTYAREARWALILAKEILRTTEHKSNIQIFPVKRGGVPVAYLVMAKIHSIFPLIDVQIVDDPSIADVIVDDLIDTGHTCRWYRKTFPDTPFLVLTKKSDPKDWIVFSWEDQSYHHPILKSTNHTNRHHE